MADPRFISVADVRRASGVTTKFISDEDMQNLASEMEYESERILNTSFTPKRTIEIRQGDRSERIVLKANPVLRVRRLEIDDDAITVDAIRLNSQSGTVWLTGDAETTLFQRKDSERNLVRVDYEYALFDKTTSQTETTSALTAGTSVTVDVSDSSDFSTGDYVEITGMDSRYEVAKINSIPDGTSIVVDRIVQTHESSSLVTKMSVPEIAKRFMIVATGLAAVARVVGQSFDEITGYGLGDMSVQKGEPYTQWRETATQLKREYDNILFSFQRRIAIY